MSRSGAVLLHGKWDGPDGAIAPLAEALAGCGLTVRRPHCCWSARRHYDVRFDQAIAEIGGETKALRAQGCDQVLLGGHSLGANAVLAAAAHGVAADALLLLAPAHRPERLHAAGMTAAAIARARAADPTCRMRLPDFNRAQRRLLRFRAEVWLSFFDPAGAAVMPRSARRLRPARPVLWLDTTVDADADDVFDLLPPHPQNRRMTLDCGHADIPSAAIDESRRWLDSLEPPRWTT